MNVEISSILLLLPLSQVKPYTTISTLFSNTLYLEIKMKNNGMV